MEHTIRVVDCTHAGRRRKERFFSSVNCLSSCCRHLLLLRPIAAAEDSIMEHRADSWASVGVSKPARRHTRLRFLWIICVLFSASLVNLASADYGKSIRTGIWAHFILIVFTMPSSNSRALDTSGRPRRVSEGGVGVGGGWDVLSDEPI